MQHAHPWSLYNSHEMGANGDSSWYMKKQGKMHDMHKLGPHFTRDEGNPSKSSMWQRSLCTKKCTGNTVNNVTVVNFATRVMQLSAPFLPTRLWVNKMQMKLLLNPGTCWSFCWLLQWTQPVLKSAEDIQGSTSPHGGPIGDSWPRVAGRCEEWSWEPKNGCKCGQGVI